MHRAGLAALTALTAVTVLLVHAPVAGAAGPPGGRPFPDTIALPDGFFPEGIAIEGRHAYVGSLVDGSIQVQDLKTGASRELAPAPPGGPAIAVGMDVDSHGRLWVAAGGPLPLAPGVTPGYRVYDTATGDLLADVPVAGGLINDVVVTDDAAWLTDTFVPQLIRVPIADDGAIGAPESVGLGGDWVPSGGFDGNGIVATPDGRRLVLAQSTAPDVAGSALYLLDADLDATVLEATRITLDAELAGADGLVLLGRTLYSVAGPPGVVVVRLNGTLTAGSVLRTIEVPDSVQPTTADVFGSRLYVVDAKFPFFGNPTVTFHTTTVPR